MAADFAQNNFGRLQGIFRGAQHVTLGWVAAVRHYARSSFDTRIENWALTATCLIGMPAHLSWVAHSFDPLVQDVAHSLSCLFFSFWFLSLPLLVAFA